MAVDRDEGVHPPGARQASAFTRACNHAAGRILPLVDTQSFEDARRGFVADIPGLAVERPGGGAPFWNLKAYGFLATEEAPDEVHPGLWRHARANMITGLFRVTDRVWQVRGMDISNMTILEGDGSLIIVDPLMSAEVARAALDFYFRHRPRRPVGTVVYSHSHVDHFGGVRGVVDEADVAAGRVQIIAPLGFMAEAASENVLAGNAMLRRALFQFGPLIPKGVRGQVDAGLGKTVSGGNTTLIPPTRVIERPVERHVIDGIECVFELTPNAEAPAEMIIHHPELRVLNMTEIACHNFHNLLPLRGAQARDSLAWSKYIDGALVRYGDASDILIAQHHWPVWGAKALQGFLARQRDLYRFVHDQTLRLMNHGHTGPEIAESLAFPEALQREWSARGFYGALRHNVKAVYQRYLGWYDGDPAKLDPLPPVDAARKAVEYMGGAEAVLTRARADFERGEYRWVASVASQVLHADPSNADARALCADAFEQLGYLAESATWRNAYLQGAMELRSGPPRLGRPGSGGRPDLVRAMPLDLFFDYLAMRVNGPNAAALGRVLNWHITDSGGRYVTTLQNGALSHRADAQSNTADATLAMARSTLNRIVLAELTFPEAISQGLIDVSGNVDAALELFALLDTFDRSFNVVEPRPPIA